MEQEDDINAMARTAPTLHGLSRVDPFKVPDGFFERFPHQVGSTIVAREGRSRVAWAPWMRWAAALPVALALLWGGLRLGGGAPDLPVPSLAEVPVLRPEELSDLAEHEVVAYLEEEGAAIDMDRVHVELNDQEMLAYLSTQNVDIAELIIELE